MGKGQSKKAQQATQAQEKLAQTLGDISQKMFTEAAPGRKMVQNYLSSIIDPTSKGHAYALQRAVSPSINAASRQYYLARKAAEESLPPGGLRDVSLRDVALQEAATKANIYTGGVNNAVDRLSNFITGNAQLGLGGITGAGSLYGQAAGNYATLANAKAQGGAAAGEGIGTIIGSILSR